MPFIHYDYLIEESLNEVYVFYADTLKFARVNRVARENLGYSMDELYEMTPLDIKPEFTASSFSELIEPLQTGKRPKIVFSTVHQRRDQTLYDIEVHLQLVTFNGYQVFVAIILDITELKRVESYNQGLNQIFNDSLNEIYIFDAANLRFTEVNRGACQNLGYSMEELHEMTPLDIKPEMTPELFSTMIMPLRLGRQEKINFTTKHRRKDGTEYPVEVHLQLSQLNNQPVFVAIILDITERQITEQAKLEVAMKSERIHILKQFISDTSHEFRTPMSVINTKLYLLRKTSDDPDVHRHLDSMEGQVLRLEQLIEGLHQLTALDATDTIRTNTVFVKPFLQQIHDDIQDKMGYKSHSLNITVGDNIHVIEVNEEMLRRAINHILQNAFAFTPNHGKIDVDVTLEDNIIYIEIHDNGIGIPEPEQERIFERLYRIDTSRSSSTGGAGLGLAIVHRIVELHHGKIFVKSKVGEGTCFCLCLPIQQHHAGSSSQLRMSV